jgi:hypothetical protein
VRKIVTIALLCSLLSLHSFGCKKSDQQQSNSNDLSSLKTQKSSTTSSDIKLNQDKSKDSAQISEIKLLERSANSLVTNNVLDSKIEYESKVESLNQSPSPTPSLTAEDLTNSESDPLESLESQLSAIASAIASLSPSSSPAPTLQADTVEFPNQELNTLANTDTLDGSKLVGAGVRRKATTVNSNNQVQASPSPEPSKSPLVLNRVSGQTRGYVILNLMQPTARQSVESQIQVLLESQIQSIYLGVLVDGTFGQDFTYLDQIISRLTQDNRNLTLALYLTNGATMRSFETTPIKVAFNTIDPLEFRSLIQYNSQIRSQFASILATVRPSFLLNRSISNANSNIAISMLEDNLDQESYIAMQRMTRSALGDIAEFMRNPCPGCYKGNDEDGHGDKIELHLTERIHTLGPGDGFTLDGVGFSYPEEGLSAPRIDEIMYLQRIANGHQLRYFGLWRHQRQGVEIGVDPIHPNNRNYEIVSEGQRLIEIEILRDGLSEVKNDG